MQKPFNTWTEEKINLHQKEQENIFRPRVREIIYTKIGIHIGFEIDKKKEFLRPVLVLAKIGSLYWVAPLTSQLKENRFHHTLSSIHFNDIQNSVVMLSHARVIDAKRFVRKIGEIKQEEFIDIQKKMERLYFRSS